MVAALYTVPSLTLNVLFILGVLRTLPCDSFVVLAPPVSSLIHQHSQKVTSSLLRPSLLLLYDSTFEEGSTRIPIANQSNSSSELGAWVPVGSASSFRGLTPLKIEIMGRHFVVWEDSSNNKKKQREESSWSVLSDVCPHRLAPLSQGRIDPLTGCIECPYHGWQFGTNGEVERIPQLDDESSSDDPKLDKLKSNGGDVNAISFPVHLTGDMIWAFLPSSIHGESFPRSLLPEDYYPGLKDEMKRQATYYSHEFLSSFEILLENGLDPCHFAFAHHGVIANRNDAGPMPMEKRTSNFTNIDIYTSYKRNGVPRERLYSFQRPFYLFTQEKKEDEQAAEEAKVTSTTETATAATPTTSFRPSAKFFLVPVREGQARLLTSVDKVSRKWLPDWITHWATQRLLAGDHILHEAELNKRQGPERRYYVQPTTADRGPRAWQQWWSQYGMKDAPPHTFGAAAAQNLQLQSRQVQEDTWRIHTSKCSKCRKVLRRARKLLVVSVAAAILGASSLVLTPKRDPASAAVAFGLGVIGSWASSRLCSYLEGGTHPSNVRDRSISMDM